MCLHFQQNSSFFQLRFNYPEYLKFLGENTPVNTFFTEELPLTAFFSRSVSCISKLDQFSLNSQKPVLVNIEIRISRNDP